MRKIFTLFAAFAVAFSATAAQPAATKNKQLVAPKQEQVSEWQKAAMSWGNKAKAAKSNSLLQGELLIPVNPDLSNNKLPSYTSVTLPMNGTIAWAPTGTVIVPSMGYTNSAAMGFTFTVAEGRGVNIAFRDFPGYCILASSQTLNDETEIRRVGSNRPILKLVQKIDISGEWTSGALAAGSYTLFAVYDPEYEGTFNFSLSLQDADPVELKSYTDIDYSTALTVGKKVYGMLGDGEGELLDPASLGGAPFTPYAKGYTIEVEQGKSYSLNFTNYSNDGSDFIARVDNNHMYGFLLTGDDLSGDFFFTDVLVNGVLEDVFVAPVSGKVRLLLMLPQDAKEVYTMELGKAEFKEIWLPYCNEGISFESGLSFKKNIVHYDEYYDETWSKIEACRGFKFSMKQAGQVTITAGREDWSPYVLLYRDEAMTDLIKEGFRSVTISVLDNKYYYLVLSDDEYFEENGADYYCGLEIKVEGMAEPSECAEPDIAPADPHCDALSLEELFNNATAVTYTSDLIYADAGTLSCDEALLGEGLRDDRGDSYCRVYKVSLKADDKLYIYSHNSDDAYLYLYALEEGDPTKVDYDDDGGYYITGEGHDSYIEFTAEVPGDYYIIATTYGGMSIEDFFVIISAVGPEDLDLEIAALNASAKSIYVEDVNNKGEILVKLSELKITGTVLGANVLLDNSVDSWLLSADRTTATYIANDEMYAFADDVEPLVITIVSNTGINDAEDDAALSVYAANGVVIILGTQGGEDVAVYNVMGSKVAAVKATSDITTVNIPCAGVYVVRVGNKSFKVIGQ